MDGWSHTQQVTISAVVLVLSTLSALGNTLMVVTIIALKKFRKSYWRQVLGLAAMELLAALSMVFILIPPNLSTYLPTPPLGTYSSKNFYLYFLDCRMHCFFIGGSF